MCGALVTDGMDTMKLRKRSQFTGTPMDIQPTSSVVRLVSARRVYGRGESSVVALDDVNLDFHAGTFTAIMGPSGSGKSTLLQCAAGLDQVTSGKVFVAGIELDKLNERQRTLLRRDYIGFVFQSFNLVPSLTATQNVELPLRFSGRRPSPAEVTAALTEVGLADRAQHRPSELSGGQQQRVALARALITRPAVLFADEPTGALDTKTSRNILEQFRRIVDQHQQTVTMVTHDAAAASYADRVIFLADGRVMDIIGQDPTDRRANATLIAAHMARLEG